MRAFPDLSALAALASVGIANCGAAMLGVISEVGRGGGVGEGLLHA